MSLRLRRGTDAERQSVLFAEGELVYTTDTKELYIGDGVTLGGIRITGAVQDSPIALTQDLDLNSFDITGAGDIDINGNITANVFYGSGAQLTNLPLLDVNNGAAYQISIVGADSSILVNSNTSEFYGDLIGNVKGSIYDLSNNLMVDNATRSLYGTFYGEVDGISKGLFVGDDSSVIVNGANGAIHTSLLYPPDNLLESHPAYDGQNKLQITSNKDRSILSLTRTEDTDVSNTDMMYGSIFFQRNDTMGYATTGIIVGLKNSLLLSSDSSGNFPESAAVTIYTGGNVGIGTFQASEKLEVVGNAKVSGFVQFGQYTTTQRNQLTPANGMVLYNTTDNRFQGYQNNAWINLDNGTAA